MGAQQTKADEDFLNAAANLEENLHDYLQQNKTNEREEAGEQQRLLLQDEQEFFNPLQDTVIPDQYHTLLPMNEMDDAHNLFSDNLNHRRNTLTVAAFAKIKPDLEEEINKCIDPRQSCEIKRELLEEGCNRDSGDIEKVPVYDLETEGANLEVANNVEINTEVQSEVSNDVQVLTDREIIFQNNSSTEIIVPDSSIKEKDKGLLNHNSGLEEISNFSQNRDFKQELLESHGVQLENFELPQQTLDIDESYIEHERNLSTGQAKQDPLHIEDLPKPIKSEITENHIDENFNTINEESGIIKITQQTLEPTSNKLNENNNKDPVNFEPVENNNAGSLNITLRDLGQQLSDKTNTCETSFLNKDLNKEPINIEPQPKENLTDSVELPESQHEPITSPFRFLKENSNDPLIFKDSVPEIKTESIEIDVAQEEIPEKVNQKYDFVKNPFAFLKKFYKNKEKIQKPKETTIDTITKKDNSPSDVIIKSELFIDLDGEEIEITGRFKKTTIKTENEVPITNEISQTLTTTDEIIIKSESLTELFPIDSNLPSTSGNNWNDVHVKSEQIEETLENYQLPFININESDDLNVSLVVNVDSLSTPASDIDELFFTQSNDDVLSNSTAITSPTSSEYHSIVEISSLDDIEFLIPTSNINKDEIKEQEKRRGRPVGSTATNKCNKVIRRGPKPKSRLNSQDKTNNKNEKAKRKPRKSTKYSEKDSAYPICASWYKDIPKPTIVTRTKETTQISNTPKPKPNTKTKNSNKTPLINEEFPKPLKLEMAGNTEKDIALELPRPMLFKTESTSSVNTINVKETAVYKTPEFQPFVRLKRLKSEELLVPYKIRKVYNRKTEYKKPTRHLRRSYPFVTKSTTTSNMGLHQYSLPNLNQREFLIQNAYSLNPRVKLHRWSMDQDNPFVNHSQLTTSSYGMPTRLSNHRQSKYFTAEELHNLFQSSPPPDEESHSHSGHFDSGVSSSTPNTSHSSASASTVRDNNNLLLEIAAERAFINNHLLHFGFSPIHFELYNNVDDLNVFIKYLFGQLNNNN